MKHCTLLPILLCFQFAHALDFTAHLREQQTMRNNQEINKLIQQLIQKNYKTVMSDVNVSIPMSAECSTDIQHIQKAIAYTIVGKNDTFKSKVLPALIDSSGRPMPGIMRGNLRFIGMIDECIKIQYEHTETPRIFRGQYVRVLLDRSFQNYSLCSSAYIMWDFCMPQSCSKNDLLNFFRAAISGSGFYSPVCNVARLRDDPDPLDYRSYVVLGIMGIISLLCLTASSYDAFILPSASSSESESFALMCLRSFSSYTIIGEILSTSTGKKPGQIPQLHCMRFFSMCWVIFGHTVSVITLLLWNPLDMLDIVGSFGGQFIVNSYYSVDTFFFQSGLLLSFLWFRAYKRNPKMVTSSSSWIMFYVHRILRLSPSYFIALAFYTFVFIHFVLQYPRIFGMGKIFGDCKNTFWQYFLYINNILDYKNTCFGVGWYVAADMQMYIFAPLLILPFTYNVTVGVAFALIVLTLSTIAHFLTILVFHFPPSVFPLGWRDPKMTTAPEKYGQLVYTAPWIRCQVYIIGFLLGYRAIYSALNRMGWALMLTWIIISCQSGFGGPINAFLSWNGWLPLGRLTYSAYLIHPIILIHLISFYDSGLIFTSLIQVICVLTAPTILFTYILSIFWSSIFEVPFAKLEALITARLLNISHRAERPRNVHPEKDTKL